MSDAELLEYCRELYGREGIQAFSFEFLSNHGSLYWSLYQRGITQRKLIASLGIEAEYLAYKNAQPIVRKGGITKRWTWERIVEEAKTVQANAGFLPPAAWFQANGQGSFVQAVYYLGHTWEKLRHELGDFKSSRFVESRSGIRWRSHPEASLSNFLYARGIEHKRGDRYPDEYAEQSDSKYGYFDLHFRNDAGAWVDVEIWGDKPGGHDEVGYSKRRRDKEKFNKDNPLFLGIHHKDCFDEEILGKILEAYVSRRPAFRFDRPTDPLIPTTHWSNTDELLEYCGALASSMPDGEFPTEEWLRKRGKWSGRTGPAYNTVSVYIKTWFGGVRNLRRLLGQAQASTSSWDRESAIEAYRNFFNMYGVTPGQVRHLRRIEDHRFTEDVVQKAGRVSSAVEKYASGSAEVNRLLGIKVSRKRKWARDKIIEGYRRAIAQWGTSPHQIIYDHRAGKDVLPDETYRELAQLVDAAGREFGGSKPVLELLRFKSPSRKRRKRRLRVGAVSVCGQSRGGADREQE